METARAADDKATRRCKSNPIREPENRENKHAAHLRGGFFDGEDEIERQDVLGGLDGGHHLFVRRPLDVAAADADDDVALAHSRQLNTQQFVH